MTSDHPAIPAPRWDELTPPEHAAHLHLLTRWVDQVLIPGYGDCGLRPCWPDHPRAVRELSTLRAEWRRIYDRPSPELAGALTWHDRWLPGVEYRMDREFTDCRGGCRLTPRIRAVH